MSRLHRPKAGLWIRVWVSILYPLDGLFFKIRWQHLERVPAPSQGGVLIAINHVSQVDTVLTARLVWQSGRVPRFMIKAGIFDWPIVGYMMKGAGQIPVYRGTADAAHSLRDAVSALERGEAVVIYPEGTTTKDPANWPMQSKTGIARLVLLAPDIPVVPVGQWGAHRMGGPSLRRLGRRRTAQASIGEPLDLSRFRGKEPTPALLREITDEIMSAVREQVAELRGEPAPDTFFVPKRVYVDKGRR
ncbi:lysophospholipid acyltransferase family protein [uncultured Jatrophihabitans sp.]|uniref:lysophospholipid acyltransferase family protein n=1 Tax=uncultured Jatrophihabitans sp. TaxID=1610747 RepID=UPI0035CB0851